MKRILVGFDVSTSCVGFGVLSIEGGKIEYIDSGYFKPKHKNNKDIFDSLVRVKTEVTAILNKYSPDYVAVEDIIKFMKGHSSATTIIGLATHNRYLGMVCLDKLGYKPMLCNVMSIRHGIKKLAGLKVLPKKEEIPDLLESVLPFKFPWKFNKKKKKIVENYDEADGIACALYAASKLL